MTQFSRDKQRRGAWVPPEGLVVHCRADGRRRGRSRHLVYRRQLTIPECRVLGGRQGTHVCARTDGLQLATQWLIRGALLLAWISWAWVAVCVTLELRSWITGHSPTRPPASRTIQSAVACLVGTALAVSLMSRGVSAENIASPDRAITSLGQLPVLEGPIRLGARSPTFVPPMTADVGTIRLRSGGHEESPGHLASSPSTGSSRLAVSA